MASQRPPRPGLDHRDLHPGVGEGHERGRGEQLELRDAVASSAALDLARRGRHALDGRAERVRRPGPRPRAGCARGSASGAGTGRRPRARRAPRASRRRSASSSSCRWSRRRGSRGTHCCGDAERREQPPHALQAEAHAEQLAAQQVLLGAVTASRASSSAWISAAFASSLATTVGRGLGAELRVVELALDARDLGLQRLDALARRASPPPPSRPAPTARSRPAPTRTATVARPVHSRRASRAMMSAVAAWPSSRAGRTAPGLTFIASRQPRTARTASIADSDLAPRPRRRARRSRAGQRASASRPSSPRWLQISSVTNGITGCAMASVSRSTCRATPPSVSSRGLTISRYQSHRSA